MAQSAPSDDLAGLLAHRQNQNASNYRNMEQDKSEATLFQNANSKQNDP